MTRAEFIKELSLHNDVAGNTEAAAGRLLDFMIETITEKVSQGEEIVLGQSLGKFVPFTQAAKTGVAMGKEYHTPEKTVIKFKPSAALKRAVAGE